MRANIFKYYSFFIILVINILFLKGIKSEVYTVGDEEEWNTQTNFDLWSRKYNFSVGDVLVFKYIKGQHNVYEVTQGTHRSCDTSMGVIGKYETGNDQVKLTEIKKYWFICNIAGHCLGGMRFSIDVKEASSNTTNPTIVTIPPPASMEPSNNSCVSYVFQRWNIGVYIATCGIILKLY